MQAEDVIYLYRLLDANAIPVWIDGGWGIDALLGQQTRLHKDLDIAITHRNVPKLRLLLGAMGYREIMTDDRTDTMFVLQDDQGRKLDVHSCEFDEAGNNIYGVQYPIASLTGSGVIHQQTVRCIALEYVLKFHENYAPDEKDRRDIQALVNKFGVKPPQNY